MMVAQWNYPTNILFGEGAIERLFDCFEAMDCHKPLIVCDKHLQAMDWFDDLSLKKQVIFDKFKSNPDELNVKAGVACYRSNHCDAVLAIGGGSALDTAKAIALMCGQTGSIWAFIDEGDNYLRAESEAIAPIIAIPTTAGTGAEVGRAAVIVDSQSQVKQLIFHPKMLASRVICDPVLSLSVPAALTAATGMDALAHLLEAYCSPGFHPMADGIALEGCRLVQTSLLHAYQNGGDKLARANMMAAATMGGVAFQKGLGLIHALSHPVGGLYDAHHGLLNAIFMPHVLQFNREFIEEKCTLLARYLDLSSHDFEGVYRWVTELNHELGIPETLSEIGIGGEKADKIAELAMLDPSASSNPKRLTHKDCKQVFLNAV